MMNKSENKYMVITQDIYYSKRYLGIGLKIHVAIEESFNTKLIMVYKKL